MKKQIHVYFSGMVQGIGFRFTAENIAGELKVTGWVRNLPDGRVELVAEQDEEVLRGYLERLNGQFGDYIREADVSWSDVKVACSGFQVRF